ncbi:AI-2E family transporter [Amnibacterium flavum]|uniref:AI-2E family transporter n=1 Tax=Amnibacterium flavum TaxID=2173173 RepID=A0A2V1HME7_9MICO|nr:AI-2E family transporter [Amnibacterium flavum]PVZ93708.1 AI-2E family transporter [Amnibacterium flavum]
MTGQEPGRDESAAAVPVDAVPVDGAPVPTGPADAEPTGDVVPNGVRIAGAWSWRILAVAGVLALVIFLIVQLRIIVIPLLIAMLIAALLVPLVNFLRRHHWPKWLAIAVAELGTIAAVGALVWLVVTQVIRGFDDLRKQTIASYDQLKQYLLDSPLHLTSAQINDWVAGIGQALQQDSQVLVSGALSVGSTLGHVATGVLLVLFSTLFLLIDGRGIWAWVVRVFPKRARQAVDGAGQAGWLTLGNFVRVQILVAFIDAVGIGLGAFILQVPLAIPIAVLVFLGSFVPVLGAVVTGTLAVFIALVYNGVGPAVIMLIIVLAVQQLEGHVLQPLIMGTAVKVHPLAVVLAVGAGAILAGIPGTLFAVPTVAVANVMIKYVASGRWRTNPHPTLKDVVSHD